MLSGPDDFRVLRFSISPSMSSELVKERENVLFTLSAGNVRWSLLMFGIDC